LGKLDYDALLHSIDRGLWVLVELWKKILLEEVDPSDKIWRINVAEKVVLGRLLRKIVKRQVIILKVIALIALELLHKTV
jgi:hypothetical protein